MAAACVRCNAHQLGDAVYAATVGQATWPSAIAHGLEGEAEPEPDADSSGCRQQPVHRSPLQAAQVEARSDEGPSRPTLASPASRLSWETADGLASVGSNDSLFNKSKPPPRSPSAGRAQPALTPGG